MVEGRLSKYFEEICLLDQSFVKNPDQKVKNLLNQKVQQFVNLFVTK